MISCQTPHPPLPSLCYYSSSSSSSISPFSSIVSISILHSHFHQQTLEQEFVLVVMSWLRSAVNKAVEANLTRSVRDYADAVVQTAGQAVAGGAKIFSDRTVARNLKSFKQTIKALEEASVSCRGVDRIQLLRRWLVGLKEIERLSGDCFDDKQKSPDEPQVSTESKDSPGKPYLVLYHDSDLGGEPLNFRDVFLCSQALEGITLSMILDAPDEEEVALLLEIFGLCLPGGRGVHNAILSNVQDLARAFSIYEDEVLVKREELLQFAQGAMTGLKFNADIARIDAEASTLQKKLDSESTKASRVPSNEDGDKTAEKTKSATIEALKEALADVRLCSRLEALLLKKKSLNNGDSPEVHSQKIDKLKVISESLTSSTTKAEKRISDHRFQKEEALKFRVAKVSEVSEAEKDMAAEISALEKQKDDLEDELKKVNNSLTAARARLRNAREEREHFDDASNQIVAHLKTKEDELARSVTSCRIEADVVNIWINFLEETWVLQSSNTEQKDKQASEDLEKYGDYFVNLVIRLLSAYEGELGSLVSCLRKFVENLKNVNEGAEMASIGGGETPKIRRKKLEEEYLEYEAKIVTTFGVVDDMKEQFYAQEGKISRKEESRVEELFKSIKQKREEFESIERPNIKMECSTPRAETPKALMSPSKLAAARIIEAYKAENPNSPLVKEAMSHPRSPLIREARSVELDADCATPKS